MAEKKKIKTQSRIIEYQNKNVVDTLLMILIIGLFKALQYTSMDYTIWNSF